MYQNSVCCICTDGHWYRYILNLPLLVQYATRAFCFSFPFSFLVYSMMHCVDVRGFTICICRQTDSVFRIALLQNCSLSSSKVVIELIDELANVTLLRSYFVHWQ